MPDRPRFSVFIATSLDGYIARPDGSIDWLEEANKRVPAGEDCGYGAFMASVDCLVMGRNTFDTVAGFPEWPYGDTRVIVLTSRPLPIDPVAMPHVSVSRESPGELAARLGREGVGHVYLDGGTTISRFLAEGLVDDLTITTIPVLIRSGRPLFSGPGADIPLDLVLSRSWDFGFSQARYRVRR